MIVYFMAPGTKGTERVMSIKLVDGKAIVRAEMNGWETSAGEYQKEMNEVGIVGMGGNVFYPSQGRKFMEQLRFAFHGHRFWASEIFE